MNKTAHVAASAVGLIGQTPVVELSRIWGGPGRILAKAEFLQPGGSVKDRAARAIIEAARADGRLKPSAPVVDMPSGNMGCWPRRRVCCARASSRRHYVGWKQTYARSARRRNNPCAADHGRAGAGHRTRYRIRCAPLPNNSPHSDSHPHLDRAEGMLD